MISKPRVSVIITTYGRTDFLSEAIESVFDQTFSDFELLIVDDNDPGTRFRQDTEKIVAWHQSLGRKIIYLQHARNRNGAAARNTGFRESSGEFISFLDSDDKYFPTRIEAAVRIMGNASSCIGGVYTGVEFRRKGKKFSVYDKVHSGNFLVESLACKFRLGTGSNLFVRRSVVEELGGFDESFWRQQDYEFMVRFFEKNQIAGTDEILVVKNNENFNQPNFARSLEIREQYLAKFRPIIEAMPEADQAYIMRCNYVWLGEIALKEGLRGKSSTMYAIAKRRDGLDIREHLRRAAFWILSWLH